MALLDGTGGDGGLKLTGSRSTAARFVSMCSVKKRRSICAEMRGGAELVSPSGRDSASPGGSQALVAYDFCMAGVSLLRVAAKGITVMEGVDEAAGVGEPGAELVPVSEGVSEPG